MKRLLALIVCAIALLGPSASAIAGATPAGGCGALHCPGGGDVGTTATGFKYVYSNDALYKVPTYDVNPPGGFTDGEPGVQYEYFYQVDCPGAYAVGADGDVGDINCNQTGTTCGRLGGIQLIVWYRPVGSKVAPTASRRPICSDGNNKVTIPELLVIVDPLIDDYMKTQNVDKPTVMVQPAQSALVNLPTIFSTPDAGTLQMTFQEPMPGTVELVPTYTWDFGDGDHSAASGPGSPYDGTDPQTHPEHYPVQHTFRQATGYTIQASVTWTATRLHIDGVGDIPITDKTRVFDATLNVQAHEAHAVLVSGG